MVFAATRLNVTVRHIHVAFEHLLLGSRAILHSPPDFRLSSLRPGKRLALQATQCWQNASTEEFSKKIGQVQQVLIDFSGKLREVTPHQDLAIFPLPKGVRATGTPPGVPQKLFRERCAWQGPDPAVDCENETQTANKTDGERRPGRPVCGAILDRTLDRTRYIQASRNNVREPFKHGIERPSGREKARGTWARTRAGSLPESPAARRGGHGVDERGLAVGPPQPC